MNSGTTLIGGVPQKPVCTQCKSDGRISKPCAWTGCSAETGSEAGKVFSIASSSAFSRCSRSASSLLFVFEVFRFLLRFVLRHFHPTFNNSAVVYTLHGKPKDFVAWRRRVSIVATRFFTVSFPKIPSGVDSHRNAESSHHLERCLRYCTRSACSSPICSSREAGLKQRICFFAISSTSLCGGHHLVFDFAAVIARCSYG